MKEKPNLDTVTSGRPQRLRDAEGAEDALGPGAMVDRALRRLSLVADLEPGSDGGGPSSSPVRISKRADSY